MLAAAFMQTEIDHISQNGIWIARVTALEIALENVSAARTCYLFVNSTHMQQYFLQLSLSVKTATTHL